jgi:hypothetical protein
VLHREALQSSLRKFACTQFCEIPAVHELLHARLDNFSTYRIDKTLIFHNSILHGSAMRGSRTLSKGAAGVKGSIFLAIAI